MGEELRDYEKEIAENLPVVWDGELMKKKFKETQWCVRGYIPQKSIVMWGGKRATCKTWTALHLAVALASGKNMFGDFETEKCSVLYIDEENGLPTMKERIEKIKAGMGIEGALEGLGIVSYEGIRIDKEHYAQAIRNFLKKHNPCVIIVDSFRRVIGAEENDAGQISQLFTEVIRPITKDFDCTWVLQHHLRKGIAGSRAPEDAMDELRGSSELTNYADVVIIFSRVKRAQDKFIFQQAKCRRAKEMPSQMVQMGWGEDGSVSFENLGVAAELLDAIDLCAKRIMVWLEENSTIEFKTKDIKEALAGEDASTRTIDRALSALVTQGKLIKPQRGCYIRPDVSPKRQSSLGEKEAIGEKNLKPATRGEEKEVDNIAHLNRGGDSGETLSSRQSANTIKSGEVGEKLKTLKATHTKGPFHQDALIAIGSLTEEDVQKAKKEGFLNEVTPGRFEIV